VAVSSCWHASATGRHNWVPVLSGQPAGGDRRTGHRKLHRRAGVGVGGGGDCGGGED